MAIDDPVDKELQYLRAQLADDSYFAVLAAKLGLSVITVATLGAHPIVVEILTSLLTVGPRRFEQRFLSVMLAFAEQQKKIQERIPDQSFYQSEKFHSYVMLVLERLHSTHDKEKLKTFGTALANSGASEFIADDKEAYIRTLRDLSLEDLQTLRKMKEISERRNRAGFDRVQRGENPSISRLTSLGLVQESTELKDFNLSIPVTPRSTQTPEAYARGMAEALKQYLKSAAHTTYRISAFGHKCLIFVALSSSEKDVEDHVPK